MHFSPWSNKRPETKTTRAQIPKPGNSRFGKLGKFLAENKKAHGIGLTVGGVAEDILEELL